MKRNSRQAQMQKAPFLIKTTFLRLHLITSPRDPPFAREARRIKIAPCRSASRFHEPRREWNFALIESARLTRCARNNGHASDLEAGRTRFACGT